MTMQYSDTIQYEGKSSSIIENPLKLSLFHPLDFGIAPLARTTANHRGYICDYAIAGGRLELSMLAVNSSDGIYPVINNVEAEEPHWEEVKIRDQSNGEEKTRRSLSNMGYHIYRDLGLAIDYSGMFTIGNDMDWMLVPHGFLTIPAWAYREVLELEFEGGALVKASDISLSFEEQRKESEGKHFKNYFD